MRDFSNYAKKTILGDSSIEYVVISMRASQYTETSDNEEASIRTFLVDSKNSDFSVENSRRVYEEKLEATVKEILDAGKKVILFGQAPMLQKDPIRCIENSRVLVSKLFKVSEERCFQFNWPWVEKRLSHSNGIFERLAKKYDLHLTIPRKYIESAKHENELIYFDDNHLNVRGSEYMGSQIPIESLFRH